MTRNLQTTSCDGRCIDCFEFNKNGVCPLYDKPESVKKKLIPRDERGFWIAMGIFFLLLIADIVSTLINTDIWKHLEANQLYPYIGFFGIILVNILYMLGFTFFYNRKKASTNARFYVLFIMYSIITIRCVAIAGNIMIYLDPPTIAQAVATSTEAKLNHVKSLQLLTLMPFFSGAFAWATFKLDHYIFRRPKQE